MSYCTANSVPIAAVGQQAVSITGINTSSGIGKRLNITITAAGKTATAQTGKFENGIEICQGWFCGFFPVDKPEYVVVIFSENTMKQKKSCSEIFASIADSITALKS